MIGQLHRAEWHYRVLSKPYGDCLDDHGGRRTVHRAARRLDREIVRAEIEALSDVSPGCDGTCDYCLGLPESAISEDPGARWRS